MSDSDFLQAELAMIAALHEQLLVTIFTTQSTNDLDMVTLNDFISDSLWVTNHIELQRQPNDMLDRHQLSASVITAL